MAEFILSSYQEKIVDFFKNNPHDNILVEALAGTGKSTLICLLTENTSTSDIYVAFNNSIAEEFRKKIKNPKTRVYTLHSLGLAIMNVNLSEKESGEKKHIGFGRASTSVNTTAKLDNFKIYKIVDDMISRSYGRYTPFERRIFIKENYVNLYNLCRLSCVDLSVNWQINRVIKNHNLFVDYSGNDFSAPDLSTIIMWLKEIDKKSKQEFEDYHIIDFVDMLYITHEKLKSGEWKVPYWNLYTNIYADEAQDMSNIQLSLLKYIKRPHGRYVFVGDKFQSVYAFNGANANAFDSIPSLFAPMTTFELPINYRCPVSHLERVNKDFKIPIQPRPNAPKGAIKTIEKNEIKKHIKPGDMIISRKNKWFSDVILELASEGIPVYTEDKDMVDNVIKTVKNAKVSTLSGLKSKLKDIVEDYTKKMASLAKSTVGSAEEETQKAQDFSLTNSKIDNIYFVLAILKAYQSKNKNATVDNFANYLSRLLNTTPNKDCVRISSVHKAKGLEAPNVFVLNEAKICTDFRNSWEQQEQEKNLSYISITRAKDKLYLVKEKDV